MSDWVNGQLINGSIDTSGSKKWRTSPFIPVSGGTEYTFSATGTDSNYSLKITSYTGEQVYNSQASYTGNPQIYIPGTAVTYVRLSVRATDYTALDGITPYFTYEGVAPSNDEGLQQTGYYIDYDSNGDFTFASDGLQKHLVFYKQVSDYTGFDWSRVENVTGYYVTNYGRRLKYRIIGYVHGVETFRSGLAEYGTPVNIRGANFDYFDIWLVDEDEDGELVQVQDLVTSKLQFSYEYFVPWPTERPGVDEDITATDYGIQLPSIQSPTLDIAGAGEGVTAPLLDCIAWLFTCLAPFLFPIATAVFIRFLVYGKEGD